MRFFPRGPRVRIRLPPTGEGIILEYKNRLTGGPVMPTIACHMQLLRAGEKTPARRRVCRTNYHVVEGAGYSIAGGQRLDWEEKDVLTHEEALLDALERGHLRGAALDVYVGEFERPPISLLWSDRRVLITPHISNASDENHHGGVNVFCDNLPAYREGRPLHNVIDWQRGY